LTISRLWYPDPKNQEFIRLNVIFFTESVFSNFSILPGINIQTTMKKVFFSIAALIPLLAFGQGFQVNLQGQKQIAMGHAGTGLRLDAASVFFNPGAISLLDNNSVSAGISPTFAHTAFLSGNTNQTFRTENPLGTPFTFYGVWGPENLRFKAGLGVYTPFGSSINWGSSWEGRFALEQITLRSIFIQPTVSFQLTENLGIGAGFVYALGNVNLQRALPVTSATLPQGRAELDGRASGIGFNAGIYYQPAEVISVGLAYRSQVNMQVENGDAIFTVPASLQTNFPTGNTFDAELPLPATISLGIGLYPTRELTLSVQADYVGWSAFDTLAFDYVTNTPALQDTRSPRRFNDSFSFRLGGQYLVQEALALRAGAYYALTPVPEGYLTPETPDADRIGLSVGAGYRLGQNFEVDASLLYLQTAKRTDTNRETSLGGTWQIKALIPGISFTYLFK
jgi:long-chain fatty acid transport protein